MPTCGLWQVWWQSKRWVALKLSGKEVGPTLLTTRNCLLEGKLTAVNFIPVSSSLNIGGYRMVLREAITFVSYLAEWALVTKRLLP